MAVDPPAPDDQSEPRVGARGSLASWIERRVWPGWERDAFVRWCEENDWPEGEPWVLFARWWREDGMWR